MKLKDLEVVHHRLSVPLTLQAVPGHERYIHPLLGDGELWAPGLTFRLGGRGHATSIPPAGYLCSSEVEMRPSGSMDVMVVTARCDEAALRDPFHVPHKRHEIGEVNHRRTVYEILGAGGPSVRLRCGETINRMGGWSSWPPHSFDLQPKLAREFEEVFFVFTDPPDGYGLMRRRGVFSDGLKVDDAIIVRNGCMYEVPLGSHPIVGSPETTLGYFWAYLSPVDKAYRKLPDGRTEYA